MNSKRTIIIGGGIVGLATAYRLIERFPGAQVTVLEKEDAVGRIKPDTIAGCSIAASTTSRVRSRRG